jgi:hypothetical protein
LIDDGPLPNEGEVKNKPVMRDEQGGTVVGQSGPKLPEQLTFVRAKPGNGATSLHLIGKFQQTDANDAAECPIER